ncbi:AraC family transcriptional regulator [Stutzerimonas stutzeri]|uniref:AraC family transcriptional regulator n=2 Tax=Pseudomonadaceae TaxID=135621 RepID=A0A2N8T4G0_STUST|nr:MULTISPECIES: helix-turn-helix domain-containing protein [Pseudomonadaceae]MCQ4324130.1 helix-turn-helix domain-containing protein [Stutzerimonas stutzeri]PNG09596.1 AraC family transcriptional regulator [Stutzerimonas stutzeri]
MTNLEPPPGLSSVDLESRLIEQELALLFDEPPAGSRKPQQRDRLPPRSLEDPRVIKAVRLIEARADQPLSLDRIAAHANLSPSRFQRRFLEVMGESPGEYLRRTRLDQAAIFLIISQQSVLSIALSVAYASHEAFIRAFHRQFGLVPTQYRQFARQASTPLAPEDEPRVGQVRVASFPSQPVLAMRFYGSYARVEENWQRFAEILEQAGFPLADLQAIGIIQDNPEITPNDLVRYDCALIDTGLGLEHPALSRLSLPAARFACLEHRAPYSHIFPVYRTIGSVWGPRSGERFGASGPGALERYRRPPWLDRGGEKWLDVTIRLEG